MLRDAEERGKCSAFQVVHILLLSYDTVFLCYKSYAVNTVFRKRTFVTGQFSLVHRTVCWTHGRVVIRLNSGRVEFVFLAIVNILHIVMIVTTWINVDCYFGRMPTHVKFVWHN